MAYLTAAEIEARLDARFGIEAEFTEGDADIASAELDAHAPFVGSRKDSEQVDAFPRSVNPDGTENTSDDPPDAVLDWVALNAYRITSGDTPAVTSWSRSGVSESYSSPMPSQAERRMAGLLAPYLLYSGRTLSSAYDLRTFESCP